MSRLSLSHLVLTFFLSLQLVKNGLQVKKDKHSNSIVIACLKRLLPVGLNIFGGRELDIVQQSKDKFLQKEPEDKIREFIKGLLEIPIKARLSPPRDPHRLTPQTRTLGSCRSTARSGSRRCAARTRCPRRL